MTKTNALSRLILISGLILLSNCGGGGGASGLTGTPQPAIARITLLVQGTPSNSPIGGIQANLHLPTGVSVKAVQNAPQIDSGVVSATGQAAGAELIDGKYIPADRMVSLYLIKTTGFDIGEFATVNCDVVGGSSPLPGDFSVSDLKAFDTNGAVITGLIATCQVSN